MFSTERFKEYIKTEYDIDYVGIAAADALSAEPYGHRPEDVLPGAKSIIVLCRRIADGVIQARFRSFEGNAPAAYSSYASFGNNNAPNFLLVDVVFNLANDIEKYFDAVAAPLPFNVMQSTVPENVIGPLWNDPYGQGMPIDIYKAAFAAGLGEFGFSGRFMTPEDGPRILLAAVLTTAELETDGPYTGPKLCDPEKCGICRKLCPTQAIREQTKRISAGAASCEVSDLKINSCFIAEMGMRFEFRGIVPGPNLIEGNDATDEELKAALAKKPYEAAHIEHYPRHLCDRCLLYCPAGNWKERFYDTGLSRFNPDTGEFVN